MLELLRAKVYFASLSPAPPPQDLGPLVPGWMVLQEEALLPTLGRSCL